MHGETGLVEPPRREVDADGLRCFSRHDVGRIHTARAGPPCLPMNPVALAVVHESVDPIHDPSRCDTGHGTPEHVTGDGRRARLLIISHWDLFLLSSQRCMRFVGA